jgi:tetratricopeptide (TPR) repeat protein
LAVLHELPSGGATVPAGWLGSVSDQVPLSRPRVLRGGSSCDRYAKTASQNISSFPAELPQARRHESDYSDANGDRPQMEEVLIMAIAKFLSASTIALLLAGPALACKSQQPAKPAQNELKQFGTVRHATPRPRKESEVPLWANLGPLTHPVTTTSSLAQRYFDQGLMFALGFNHAEARRNFQAAQRLDPFCAMCFWGEALVLGPNINAPMDPAMNEAALAALGQATHLIAGAREGERALIGALAARYSADPKAERAALDRAYADAMVEVAERFPADQTVAVLAAEALMDVTPWDYWEAGGATPKGRTATIVALLERVLAANPDHPGAIHLYIHAVEASDRPERAEAFADRLAAQNLDTGHLVHMPSHIYYRVGRYADSLSANRKAAAADEAFFAKVTPEGIYAGGYYPHNIHFLMVSAQMAGDGATAVEAAEKLQATVSDEAARSIPWVQPIKAAPLFAHAQFSEPERILELDRPTGDMPYVNAMWHYARGVAQAARGDLAAARREADAIATLAAEADLGSLAAAGIPAEDVLAIARLIVLGRIEQAQANWSGAVASFEAAAALEDKLAYMEPPFWYYPVRQSLGAALLQAGDAARAAEIFRASLKAAPHNGWALYGLREALARQGDAAGSEDAARRLELSWAGAKTLSLSRL